MAQVCTICAHKSKDEINQALLTGQSIRSIASQHGLVVTSVRRHRDNHLPEHMSKAKEAEEITQADTLIGDLQFLKDKAMTLLGKAQEVEDLKAASSLIGQARQVIETLAEVRGELDKRQTVNVLILQSPEWTTIKQIITEVLNRNPELKSEFIRRLEGVKCLN